MVILLLIIIASVLLFGAQNTKNGIWTIIIIFIFLGIIGTIANSCGLIDTWFIDINYYL